MPRKKAIMPDITIEIIIVMRSCIEISFNNDWTAAAEPERVLFIA